MKHPRADGQPTAVADRDGVEEVLARMREAGGRATPARRLLLRVLFSEGKHRSAEELAAEVQAQAPDVNISTIYRNLDELVRLGVVDRTYLGGGPASYHLASAAHGHIFCEHCGAMTEVPDELFADLADVVAARYGFAIAPHRFAVTGLCADCQKPGAGSGRPG
jgi:Fur family transcriptional regulator, ferric uptake regulator